MGDDYDYDAYLDRSDKNNWRAGSMPNIQSAPRRAGKASSYITDGLRRFAAEYCGTGRKPDALAIDNMLTLIQGAGAVLVWTSNSRFTYAAVYAAGRWFTTGQGGWYGKNVFEPHEFIDVMLHDQVTSISFSQDFVQLYAPPPF